MPHSFRLTCGALHDLVPFVQFEKREKHPWRSATSIKVAGNFTKSNTPPWVFFTFFKLYKWNQIAQNITDDFFSMAHHALRLCPSIWLFFTFLVKFCVHWLLDTSVLRFAPSPYYRRGVLVRPELTCHFFTDWTTEKYSSSCSDLNFNLKEHILEKIMCVILSTESKN